MILCCPFCSLIVGLVGRLVSLPACAQAQNTKLLETLVVHIEATTKEKLYIVASPEFEELQGHIFTKPYMA